MEKRSISAKVLVEDIKSGLTDAELMTRHQLNPGQLHKAITQLVGRGYVAQHVLDARKRPQPAKTQTPAAPERDSRGPSPGQASETSESQASSKSLPLSREQAARVRRNGLILIIASFGFLTTGVILNKHFQELTRGFFAPQPMLGAFTYVASIGWLVTSILGCLWRVRGLGHNALWAIVGPVSGLNLIVLAALSNRYEPDSHPTGLRVIFAGTFALVWLVVSSQLMRLL